MQLLNLVLNTTRRLIEYLVVALLGWMVLIAISQLILRSLFSTGIPWADLQMRQLVLLIALFGGVLAAADNRHIRIDLLKNYLPRRYYRPLSRVVLLIAAAVLLALSWLSVSFIQSEFQAGSMLRSFLFGSDLPYWYIELAIPLAFFLMGIFFLQSVWQKGDDSRHREKL